MTELNPAGNYLLRDLLLVYESRRSPHFGDSLVEIMGLAGQKRDGLTLGERVVGTSAFENVSAAGLEKSGVVDRNADVIPIEVSDLFYMIKHIGYLVTNIESGNMSDGERVLASSLSKVVTRQIIREGNICEIAGDFASRVSRVRPDLINPKILS